MDWNKYRAYTNDTTTNAFWGGHVSVINFYDAMLNGYNNIFNQDPQVMQDRAENVVADVTDSYKELSSEMI